MPVPPKRKKIKPRVCIACQGSGKSSKGGICFPCKGKGSNASSTK